MIYRTRLPEGIRFLKDKPMGEHIIDEVWNCKIYDQPGFRIRKNFIIIDIGAHRGVFTVFAAKKCKTVYAYEPHPENFRALKRNLKINKVENARIFNYAVNSEVGDVKLFLNSISFLHSTAAKTDKSMIVRATTLKDIFDENNIDTCDFLKIDTEGSEYDILSSTPEEYFRKIGMIVLEYHNVGGGVWEIVRLLSKRGFKIKLKPCFTKDCFCDGILYAKNDKIGKFGLRLRNEMNLYISKIWQKFVVLGTFLIYNL